LLGNRAVDAQDTDSCVKSSVATFNMFREPSYVLFGSGFGNIERLIFEADIIPYYKLKFRRNVKWGIELSPRVILRMYNKESFPVRTPSFIPRVNFYYQFADADATDKFLFAFFSWYHHSNGQDGSFYMPDSITINTRNGNFSSNRIEGGVFLSRPRPDHLAHTNYLKLSVSYAYQQETELNGILSRWQYGINYQSNLNFTRLFRRVTKPGISPKFMLNQSVSFGWIAGTMSGAAIIDLKRVLFEYTISFQPSFLDEVYLFAQYNYGSDYYNIYFSRQINLIRFGIASKPEIFN
jgi:hypothetical protein